MLRQPDCHAELPASAASRALPASPHCVRSAAGLSRARCRTRANPWSARQGTAGGSLRGREKEQEGSPEGRNTSSVTQGRHDLLAMHFPAKRHQPELFLARPTRVGLCVKDGIHLAHSSLFSLDSSLRVLVLQIKSPLAEL